MLAKAEVDDDSYRRSHGSSMLGGDMFENERRLVMAGSAGMDEDEFDLRCRMTRSC